MVIFCFSIFNNNERESFGTFNWKEKKEFSDRKQKSYLPDRELNPGQGRDSPTKLSRICERENDQIFRNPTLFL